MNHHPSKDNFRYIAADYKITKILYSEMVKIDDLLPLELSSKYYR